LPGSFRERGELIVEIEEEANLSFYHPFQIHLATWKEAEVNPIYREAVSKGIPILVSIPRGHRRSGKTNLNTHRYRFPTMSRIISYDKD